MVGQIAVALSALQEEASLRAAADKELENMASIQDRRVNGVESKYEDFSAQVDAAVGDATKRVDDLTRQVREESRQVRQLITDETLPFRKMLEKASRDFERQQHALEEETEQRNMEFGQLMSTCEHIRELLSAEQKERVSSLDEMRVREGQTRRAITEETKDRLAGDAEQASRLRELAAKLDTERSERVNTNQFQTAATEALERQLEAASAETYAKTHETELMVQRLDEAQKAFPSRVDSFTTEVRDTTKEITTTLNALKVEVAEQMRERLQGDGSLQAGLDEQKALIEALGRTIDKTGREVGRAEAELKGDVERAKEELNATIVLVDTKVLEEEKGRERTATTLEMKQESLGQELRALISAERSSRADQDEKLRNDTIDAVQKEISARQDADQSLIAQLTRRMEKEEEELREQSAAQQAQITTLGNAVAEVRAAVDTVEQAVLAGAGAGALSAQEEPESGVSMSGTGTGSQASSRRRR
jgi:hypothetical protein